MQGLLFGIYQLSSVDIFLTLPKIICNLFSDKYTPDQGCVFNYQYVACKIKMISFYKVKDYF